jgi:L-lactate permease
VDPAHSTLGSTLVALVPIVLLLVLLAVFRMSAWQAVIIGATVTIILAITVWNAPTGSTFKAWAIGAGTGIWSIDWITFWGVIIYNTLVETGAFEDFKRWLIRHATRPRRGPLTTSPPGARRRYHGRPSGDSCRSPSSSWSSSPPPARGHTWASTTSSSRR